MKIKYFISTIIISLALLSFSNQATIEKKKKQEPEKIESNINGSGYIFEFQFTAGKEHNHPTMALWIEDTQGNFIQPLFVTSGFAHGVYNYGKQEENQWVRGTKLYRAALPYFVHKWTKMNAGQGFKIPSPENPVNDAYTGATPKSDFLLETRSDNKSMTKFRLILEVNQTWDFNDYWHNAKFPEDNDYKTSCQPSLVYAVDIDIASLMDSYVMNPIGHGHYSGKDGRLYTDISTLTTAKEIFEKIEVHIMMKK